MNEITPPSALRLIPENAPFSPEQRVWLSGFFAGLISTDGAIANGVTPLSPEQSAALMPAATATEEDDGAPWHDQTMPMAERMQLAEGRPLRRRMMAAMAQQDCGQCGYNCQDYADALSARAEERLNLCVPGGKETARMLKALYQELESPAAMAVVLPPQVTASSAGNSASGRSRDAPVTARLVSRTRLNKPGSEKETWHVEFDLAESGVDYVVGDAFGVFPTNDPVLVDAILKALDAPAEFPIGGRALRDVLIDSVSLSPAPDMLFQLYSYITGGERRQKARRLHRVRIPMGTRRRSTCLRQSKSFAGCGPIRKPSSKRSMCCSPGFIPSPPR